MIVHVARNCPGKWEAKEGALICNRCGARTEKPSSEDRARAAVDNAKRIARGLSDREPGTRG